jgi:hypothetical protein
MDKGGVASLRAVLPGGSPRAPCRLRSFRDPPSSRRDAAGLLSGPQTPLASLQSDPNALQMPALNPNRRYGLCGGVPIPRSVGLKTGAIGVNARTLAQLQLGGVADWRKLPRAHHVREEEKKIEIGSRCEPWRRKQGPGWRNQCLSR